MINGLRNLVKTSKKAASITCESRLASGAQIAKKVVEAQGEPTASELERAEATLKPAKRGVLTLFNRHPLAKLQSEMESLATEKILEHVGWCDSGSSLPLPSRHHVQASYIPQKNAVREITNFTVLGKSN